MATEKIMIGIDDQVVELKGADKDAFIADRDAREQQRLLLETARLEKETARASALTKLGEIAGLTKEELDAIL
jgi:hypothetical protein